MGRHNRHSGSGAGMGGIGGAGGVRLPPPMDPVTMRLMNANQPAPNVGVAMHNRQVRTAETAFITVNTPQGVICFPFGGFTDLEYASLAVAQSDSKMSPADIVSRARAILDECKRADPPLDPNTGMPMAADPASEINETDDGGKIQGE